MQVLEKKQLALVLGRQQALVEEDDEELQELQFNTKLSEQFLGLVRGHTISYGLCFACRAHQLPRPV